MKYLYLILTSVFATVLFTNCAGNKDLQENSPAQFGDVYTTTNGDITTLYVPLTSIQTESITLDSVYYKNMKSILEKDTNNEMLYKANFQTGKPDIIMSSDPKEEYGNKLPQKSVKSPFELKDDEAILVFSQKDKTKYYKFKNIKQRTN